MLNNVAASLELDNLLVMLCLMKTSIRIGSYNKDVNFICVLIDPGFTTTSK